MSDERHPLLTEEQIQEMLNHKSSEGTVESALNWLFSYQEDVWGDVTLLQWQPDFDINFMLAFLRGKTKRVLNIDRLRADVKAWVDDPDRKWPEYLVSLLDFDHRQELASDSSDLMEDQIQLCMFAASIIGINPDDYFEEVEVEDGVQH